MSNWVKQWRALSEGRFYKAQTDGVQCLVCPHKCLLKDYEIGACNSRVCIDGKIFSMVYGKACAYHDDPIEKKPLYHFYPGRNTLSLAATGCNMHCLNCQNWSISQSTPNETQSFELSPAQAVIQAQERNSSIISFTYTEPLVWFEYMYDTALLAHEQGIKTVLISGGFVNEEPRKMLLDVIDAANIDLKSFDDSIYKRLNKARLQPVLDTLIAFKEAGIWLEITNLIIPEWTDDLNMIGKMCKWLYDNGFEDTPLHFSRFYPNHKLDRLPPTSFEVMERAWQIARNEGLKYVYLGNVPGSEKNNTFCHNCGRRIVARSGFHSDYVNFEDGMCMHCDTKIPGIW